MGPVTIIVPQVDRAAVHGAIASFLLVSRDTRSATTLIGRVHALIPPTLISVDTRARVPLAGTGGAGQFGVFGAPWNHRVVDVPLTCRRGRLVLDEVGLVSGRVSLTRFIRARCAIALIAARSSPTYFPTVPLCCTCRLAYIQVERGCVADGQLTLDESVSLHPRLSLILLGDKG